MNPYMHFFTQGTISASDIFEVLEIDYSLSEKIILNLLKNGMVQENENIIGEYSIVCDDFIAFKNVFDKAIEDEKPKKLTKSYFNECVKFLVSEIKKSDSRSIGFDVGNLGTWSQDNKWINLPCDYREIPNLVKVVNLCPLFSCNSKNMQKVVVLKSELEGVGIYRFPSRCLAWVMWPLKYYFKETNGNIDFFVYAYRILAEDLKLTEDKELEKIVIASIETNNSNFSYNEIKIIDQKYSTPILFNIKHNNKTKYILSEKLRTDQGIKIVQTYESNWIKPIYKELPNNLSTMKELFNLLVDNIVREGK